MPNRILYEKVCASETLAELSAEEERFFFRLLVQCDDYGRFDARPSILRARCFPLQLDTVGDDDVDAWLSALARVGLVRTYEVEGRRYLLVVTWNDHQQTRAKKSKYPEPCDGAKSCRQMQADADIGARIRYPESLSGIVNPESDAVRASASADDGAGAPTGPPAGAAPPKRSSRKTPPPASLEPSEDDYRAGADVGLGRADVVAKVPAMLDHYRARGETRADWHSTLRGWLRNAPMFDQPRAPPIDGRRPSHPISPPGNAPVSYLEVSDDAT